MQLPLDLEPDDEEEDHHQSVVDPEMDVAFERQATDAQPDGRMQESVVSRAPGRVRPDEGGDCRGEQEDAARCLDGEKGLDRRK